MSLRNRATFTCSGGDLAFIVDHPRLTSRRYIRRLIGLAFLSPELIEAILQGRQSVELTATRLTELDLPLDWTEQHKLLAS